MPKPCLGAAHFLALGLALAFRASAIALQNSQPLINRLNEPLHRFGKATIQNWQEVKDANRSRSQSVEKANEVDVLAFGDSLTHGYGRLPYPEQLQEMLNTHGHGRTVYRVTNAGIPGELTSSMVVRLPQTIAHLKKAGRKPTFVLTLGGTNDIMWGNMTSDKILANLRNLRGIVLSEHMTPVLFTIPPLDVLDARNNTQTGIDARNEALRNISFVVNEALRNEARRDTSILLADISEINTEHLVDGVHFSGKGYARIADIAFDVLKPMLS
jgi:lysophospholipase L1-like esterase